MKIFTFTVYTYETWSVACGMRVSDSIYTCLSLRVLHFTHAMHRSFNILSLCANFQLLIMLIH